MSDLGSSAAFDRAHEKVGQLSTIFDANKARYMSAQYSEADVRNDFINKFFSALGWDVDHGSAIRANVLER